MDHEILARAETRYLRDDAFREQVENVVVIMTNATGSWTPSNPLIQQVIRQERLLMRMTAAVAMLTCEEEQLKE